MTTKILMELRTCFEGFAGIPQETRLLFSAFLDRPELQVHGLINHTGNRLGKGLKPEAVFEPEDDHKRYDKLSKFVASTLGRDSNNWFTKKRDETDREVTPSLLAARAKLGIALKLYSFDARAYSDFVWETLFSASLQTDDLPKIANVPYRTLGTPWRAMHRAGLIGRPGLAQYPTVDTRGYDIVFVQTPYPARISKGSQLVVRYHDAIPMFQTNTIPTAHFHRKSHYRALLDNAPHAVFACTSHAVRGDLLRMFPALESRSTVVHDVVSHNYFPEAKKPGAAAEIIRSRLNPHTEPKIGAPSGPGAGSGSSTAAAGFYEKHLGGKPLRFLLMVSSIEPRKNHDRLVRAWEILRARGDSNLKLVLVGSLGWHIGPILESFKSWQARGQLFHLSGVPSSDLRQLYAAAECVICPSIAEGFDLSGIEAMACGGVVAASDIAVHREVYGAAARYFDKFAPEHIADTIGELIDPLKKRQTSALRKRGIAHAAQYQREVIAPQWGELFARVQAGEFKQAGI